MLCSWTAKFFCLSDKDTIRVPCTSAARESFIKAGLGPKSITIENIDSMSSEDLKKQIVSNFPKLDGCGGFVFLRCIQNSEKHHW